MLKCCILKVLVSGINLFIVRFILTKSDKFTEAAQKETSDGQCWSNDLAVYWQNPLLGGFISDKLWFILTLWWDIFWIVFLYLMAKSFKNIDNLCVFLGISILFTWSKLSSL